MSENDVMQVTDDSFETEVLQANIPVMVDFWAPWCGPCKMIGPIVEELGRENTGKIKIAKMNVDDNKGAPVKYGIRGVPTLIVFKDGKPAEQIVGAANKARIQAMIDKVVAAA